MAKKSKSRPTYDRAVMGAIFLEELRKGQRISAACRTLGIGRATIWRWAQEDPLRFGRVLEESLHGSQRQRLGPTPDAGECAYAAGFFDGEGTVGIRRGHFSVRNQRRWFQLGVSLSNTHYGVLEWLHTRWKGMVSQADPNTVHSKPWRRWQLSGVNAEKFLLDVFPFLLVKRPQAELAFAFQRFIQLGQMQRTAEDYDRIWQFHVQMRHLNQRGTRPVVILRD